MTAVEPRRGGAHRRARQFRLLGAGIAVLAYLAWLVFNHAGGQVRMSVSDLVFVLAPAVATLSCIRTARRRGPDAAAWAWVAAGCAIWCLGSVIWASYEFAGDVAPFPSVADICYVGYAAPILVGLCRFSREPWQTCWSLPRLVADAVTICAALLYSSTIFVLRPALAVPASTLVRLDLLGYPLADVMLAAAVLSLATSFVRTGGRRWTVLTLGLLTQAVTDSAYAARTVQHTYHPGHLLDAGWLISFLLLALAPAFERTSGTAAPASAQPPAKRPAAGSADATAPSLAQQLLPFGPLLLAAWAFTHDTADFGHGGRYFWTTLSLLGLLVLCQLVAAVEHASLTRGLAAAVNRRTADLAAREQWWATLVRNLTDVIIVIDRAGRVTYCSPAVGTALGHRPDTLTGVDGLRHQIHPDDADPVTAAFRPVLHGRVAQAAIECRLRRGDGRWAWFEVTGLALEADDPSAGSLVLILHDVTERRRLTDELSFQAFHDSLTGLPNRAFLLRRLASALAEARGGRIALGLMDLDDFKLINDTHGHPAGDEVLCAVAGRLQAAVRAEDVVARLGGDEFAILMHDVDTDVEAFAERVAAAVSGPVTVDARQFEVRASIGVVLSDLTGGESAAALLAHADIALYEAKARNRGRAVVIGGEQRAVAAARVRLRQVVAQPPLEEFWLQYQPLVGLDDFRLRAVEALLRWNRPGYGPVSPEEFIPLAEQAGSVDQLGWHVLETACSQLAAWSRRAPDFRLALGVNVSIRQLHEDDFVCRVRNLLDRHAIEPDRLVLEITEQSLARDFETAVCVVSQLRQAGISVAVDDFGTGYSSLRYLDRFAADVVKIDRSFTGNLPHNEHTRKLVRSVVQMSQSLDLQTVAEGIETDEQLEIVRSLGFEIGQGFLFAPPLDAPTIGELVAAGGIMRPEQAAPGADVPVPRDRAAAERVAVPLN